MKKSERREIMYALSSITQFGLSVAISFILWIIIASVIKKAFNLGNYVMVAGVVLGALSAAMTVLKFCTSLKNKKGENNERK